MKFIKKNSSTIVGIVVFILVLVGIFAIKNVIAPDESAAIYGNRLEGRKDVEISNETKKKVQAKVENDTTKATVRVSGRIINIHLKAKEDTTLEVAKQLGDKVLEEFSKKEKEYYDYQIIIENTKNTKQFPIIGYKQHTKEKITWTKDRVES